MAETTTHNCAVCGANDWLELPTPGKQSITTAGKIVPDALGKGCCNSCGVVQKVFRPRLGETDFYEKEYTYYDRPGASSRDQIRYQTLAKWVAEAIEGRSPKSIFDIGCGQGNTLEYLKEHFPNATLGGLEPYEGAVKIANDNGLNVLEGRIDNIKVDEKFDLVFSNNVIQHVLDPIAFLQAQKALLAEDGDLVLTCPDGTLPNVELLMADQNISLRPVHLEALAAKAGLRVVKTLPCPGGPLRNEQLVLLKPDDNVAAPSFANPEEIKESQTEITQYLDHWASLDDVLLSATKGAKRIYNFGGGLWSYVLAAYCPSYWAKIEACVVDTFSGVCIDKEVRPFEKEGITADDVMVLGTNPYVQQQLVERFKKDGLRAVAFDHMIPH
ncbi:MAG: class I SAM-dependent methyltransferase [Rickettsiales bacterium]